MRSDGKHIVKVLNDMAVPTMASAVGSKAEVQENDKRSYREKQELPSFL